MATCCWALAQCAGTKEYLYVETPAGALATYLVEPDGSLNQTGSLGAEQQRLPYSDSVVSLAIQPGGKFAYSTDLLGDLLGGVVKCYTVDSSDGRLLPNPAACDPPLTVQGLLTMAPNGRFLYVSQYGQANYAYAVDQATGKLTKVEDKIESGMLEAPVFTQSGKFAYVLHRRLNNVASYKIATNGSMQPVGETTTGAEPIAMAVDPGGYFAYVANNDNAISEYFIDPSTGALRANPSEASVATGKAPSSIVVDASGRFLYCVNSSDHSISQYRIQPDGTLQRIGEVTGATIGTGTGPIVMDPRGEFIWNQSATGWKKSVLTAFRIESDGHLVPVNSAPVPVASGAPRFTPATSWSGSPPVVQIVKRNLGPLLAAKMPIAGTFTKVGRMAPPRGVGGGGFGRPPRGTSLPDGRAFIPEAGWAAEQPEVTGEIYDPKTGSFSPAGFTLKGALLFGRLRDGRFLIFNGQEGSAQARVGILDPVTMRTTSIGSLKTECVDGTRYWLLNTGRLLFPYRPASGPGFGHPRPACAGQIFDLSSAKSVPTPGVLSNFQIIAVLPDDRLLLVPPIKSDRNGNLPASTIGYIYALATGRMQAVGSLYAGREFTRPVTLKDGTLFFLTGQGLGWPWTAELFDPAGPKFIRLGQLPGTPPDRGTILTRLLDGRVLIIGSGGNTSAKLFDPATRTFTPTGSMTTFRPIPTVVVLPDGNVLFAGSDAGAYASWQGLSPYDTAEIYHPPRIPAP